MASAAVKSSVPTTRTTVAVVPPLTPTRASIPHHSTHSAAAAAMLRVRRTPPSLRTTGAESTAMSTAFAASSTDVSQAGPAPASTMVGRASASIMLVIA